MEGQAEEKIKRKRDGGKMKGKNKRERDQLNINAFYLGMPNSCENELVLSTSKTA